MKNEDKQNPLLCDPIDGVCAIPGSTDSLEQKVSVPGDSTALIIDYFTDPICSTCWGVEPQLKKLKLEYGNLLHINYHMGGLLPSWDIYDSGGISKPSDVAHHWDEVSAYYKMPIDGDIWLEDPLNSSYPPSIGYKAAEMQSKEKAVHFLRVIREKLFLQKVNITSLQVMSEIAGECGLDTAQFRSDYQGPAEVEFKKDLRVSRERGVKGFPTFFFSNQEGTGDIIYGYRSYEHFESLVLKLYPQAEARTYDKSPNFLLNKFGTLTTREFEVLAEISFDEAESTMLDLFKSDQIGRIHCKNGDLWLAKK
jgi:predicted DsbA family dithiol-disulfide isomerase